MTPKPLFYALPAVPLTSEQNPIRPRTGQAESNGGAAFAAQQDKSPAVVPLYEYRRGEQGAPMYSTDPDREEPGLMRSAQPLCRVWRNPQPLLILDRHAMPA